MKGILEEKSCKGEKKRRKEGERREVNERGDGKLREEERRKGRRGM